MSSKARWWSLLVVVAGCGTDAPEPEFELQVAIDGLDPVVDAVWLGDERVPVLRQQDGLGTVTLHRTFASYEEGLAAGELVVDLVAGDEVLRTGSVAVGACTTCQYSFCPTADEIELERIEYVGVYSVSPLNYGCFTCAGGTKHIKACP
ncbi:MAG: hypothetical protein ACTHU0_24370 [Kofleriaceae bacterium]